MMKGVPAVRTAGRTIELHENESVLEALERCEIDVPSGCRAGTCCKCMLQAEDPPPESQRNLRPTLRAQGYFLACQARPQGTLDLLHRESPPLVTTRVDSFEAVAADVARLLLRPEGPFPFRPGQYLDVLHPSGVDRSYSIASLPADGVLELHVRRVPGGLVSNWLHERKQGDAIQVRGTFGQCFHVADDADKPLLLVGAGTGLAPLLGIARDALDQGHAGKIDLVHGALRPDRLYLREELAILERTWPQLNVHHCVLQNATEHEHEGQLDEIAIGVAEALSSSRVFLCGDAEIVRKLQRSLFLAGVPSGEILADPFLPARP